MCFPKALISEPVLGYEHCKANFQFGGSVHTCEILNCQIFDPFLIPNILQTFSMGKYKAQIFEPIIELF